MSDSDATQMLPPQAVLMQMSVGYAVPFLLRVAASCASRIISRPGYRTLLKKANFTLTWLIPTPSPVSIVEATPA